MITPLELYIDEEHYRVMFDEITHPVHNMFHVQFDDGYENIFFSDVETGEWIEQDVGFTRLAALIGEHISYSLPRARSIRKDLAWHHSYCSDGIIEFGYHRDVAGNFPVYEIFAPNKRYMFTLVKLQTDTWQLFKIPGSGWDYSERYIHEVPFILSSCQL